jgi:O-antigen ligase
MRDRAWLLNMIGDTRNRRFSSYEIPFWVTLLLFALVPSRAAAIYRLGDIPIEIRDVLLLFVAVLYLVPILHRALYGPKIRSGSAGSLMRASLLFAAYAAFSIGWSGLQTDDAESMGLTLLLFACSVLMPYEVVCLLERDVLAAVLKRSIVVFAVVCAIYSADSFFQLGFRSPEYMRMEPDFPIPRVGGPLFGASTGYFLILPALAYALEEVWRRGGHRTLGVVCSLLMGITLFALGSRGSVALTLMFVGICFMFLPSIRRKVLAIASVLAVVTLGILLVTQSGEANRISSFEDEGRLSLHNKSWELITTRSIPANLFGSGYGSVWPWYRLDDYVSQKKFEMAVATRDDLLVAGKFLYHPHSVLLLLVVEMGLVGAVYFVLIWKALLAIVRLERAARAHLVFACGLLASGCALFLDLFLFYHSRVYMIWWFWVFAALRLSQQASRRPARPETAGVRAHVGAFCPEVAR